MNSSTNLFDLKNKTVILTGSAGRLGSRFAQVLSSVGANVVLVDIDDQKNSKLEKSLIKKFGTKPMLSNTDISNQNQVRKTPPFNSAFLSLLECLGTLLDQ